MAKKRSDAQKQAEKKYDSKRKGRTRNFATVVYPESAPQGWQETLSENHVAALISPLHDKDVNPSGELKKPHYHVLVMYESVKDFEGQVKPLFDEIGGVGRENVNSARGYARYLCHLDNPEKYQYNPIDVVQLGGADYAALIHLPTDDLTALGDVMDYIRVNQICSLAELLDICKKSYPDWFAMIAMNRGYIVDKYIKSLNWEFETGYVRKTDIDTETGEVIE